MKNTDSDEGKPVVQDNIDVDVDDVAVEIQIEEDLEEDGEPDIAVDVVVGDNDLMVDEL